jgi:type I restriction enzyme, S subunit
MERSSWRETTLGDFVRLQRGHDLPAADRRPGNVPIMGSAGVNGFHDTAKAKGPGVVIGRSGVGSMGVVSYCENDYWPHNTVLYVTDFLGNDPRFTYYFLRQLGLRRFDSGSAQASLNRNYIYPISICVPSPVEQRAIARILGTLDDKIELNRRMNETLEAIARALFKSWFVDFEPVRAKCEGRDPDLPKPLADLFPDAFGDTQTDTIPMGWEVKPLYALASYLNRGLSPVYVEAGGICVLNQKCIRDRRIDFTRARRHDVARKSVQGRTLHTLDILINSTGVGTLGRIAQVWHLPEEAIADSHVTIVRAAEAVDPWFLGATLIGREMEVEALGEGSTGQTELNRHRLGQLACLVPSREIQGAFGRLVAPLLSRLTANEKQSRILAALRDALLPKLISGELKVGDTTKGIQRLV